LYDLTAEPAPSLKAFMSKTHSTPGLTFRSMDPRRFDQEIAEVVRIFNDAWAENWGFVAMSNDDLRYLAQNIRRLLRPGDVAFGELGGTTVAMAVCLPNVNEAIADFGGRLLPANWLKLLWRLKVAGLKSARLPLMGVVRRYQGTALGAALMLGVIQRVREWHRAHGTQIAELSWILEENRPMRRMIELVGGRPHKTYRIYQKVLA
jgi:GNAT superfamily N-acetyltransferase